MCGLQEIYILKVQWKKPKFRCILEFLSLTTAKLSLIKKIKAFLSLTTAKLSLIKKIKA